MLIRRGQRVVLRSKVRSERRRVLGVVALLALLAGLGVRTVQDQRRHGRSPWRWVPVARLRAVEVSGLEEPQKGRVAGAFADLVGKPLAAADPAAARERLRALDPALRLDALETSWVFKTTTLRIARRRPLARCADSRPAGMTLDDAGELYEDPDGSGDLPRVLGACAAPRGQQERRALAAFLVSWNAAGPQGLELKTVRPSGGGWELELSDGAAVRWGSSDPTRLKQQRLRAVLEDGRRRFGGSLQADLRFFDQGRILVAPAK